jgi:hypothetical protein
LDDRWDKAPSATKLIELELRYRFPLVPTRSLAWLVAFADAVPGKGRLECAVTAMAAWQAEVGPEAEPEAEPEPVQLELAQPEAAKWNPWTQRLPMPEAGDSYAGCVDDIRRSRKKMRMDDCPVRAAQGRLSALRVFLCRSVLYGDFVWVHRALKHQKPRFPARAGRRGQAGGRAPAGHARVRAARRAGGGAAVVAGARRDGASRVGPARAARSAARPSAGRPAERIPRG